VGEYRVFSDSEKAILNQAILDGTKATQLRALLPGRNAISIQNALNNIRRSQEGRCLCGEPVDREGYRCQACLDKSKESRDALKRRGICTKCRKAPVGDGGTLTLCQPCAENRREYNRTHAKKKASKGKKTKAKTSGPKMPSTPVLLKWTHASAPWKLKELWPEFDHMVDVFGGAGRFALWAHRDGHTATYNDLNPLAVDYFLALQEGSSKELYQAALAYSVEPVDKLLAHYRAALLNPSQFPRIQRAALIYLVAKSSAGKKIGQVVPRIKMPDQKLINPSKFIRRAQNIDTRCEDFATILREYDGPDTFFMLDPPFPGTETYEHNLDHDRFEELVGMLHNLKGKFLMALGTHRRSIAALQGFEHLFLRTVRIPYVVHEVLVSNYPIPERSNIRPLDPKNYGIHSDGGRLLTMPQAYQFYYQLDPYPVQQESFRMAVSAGTIPHQKIDDRYHVTEQDVTSFVNLRHRDPAVTDKKLVPFDSLDPNEWARISEAFDAYKTVTGPDAKSIYSFRHMCKQGVIKQVHTDLRGAGGRPVIMVNLPALEKYLGQPLPTIKRKSLPLPKTVLVEPDLPPPEVKDQIPVAETVAQIESAHARSVRLDSRYVQGDLSEVVKALNQAGYQVEFAPFS